MSNEVLEFGGFRLEPGERRLTRGGEVLEVSGRYLDALLLLTSRPGELVTKESFMTGVWRGVPVTDEALTQCIRTLRKALGDQAGRPRFIETVPRHGYRFVADVRKLRSDAAIGAPGKSPQHVPQQARAGFLANTGRSQLLLLSAAGLVGGAGAGLVGGIGYGLIAATEPPAGTGAISILLVMTCLCVLIGLLGGCGVAGGSAMGRLLSPGRLFATMLGGALGGMAIGAAGRLIALDAFSLLIGSRPLAVTGGSEGLLIGAMAGTALWLAERNATSPLSAVVGTGALLGGSAGLLVTLGGGRMMIGSLSGLATAHPDAPLGRLLAELTAPVLLLAGAAEGAIFIAALSLAFALVLRSGSAR